MKSPENVQNETNESQEMPLNALDQATLCRKACLVHVGSVEILDRESLDELQFRVQVLLSAQKDYLLEHFESIATGTSDISYFYGV